MADRLADGKLEETITELAAERQSPERIAQELVARFGVRVTRQTITNWLRALRDPEPEGTAA